MKDPTPSPRRFERIALALLLALLLGWGLIFIERSSFRLAGRTTFCLFDDAMISMTYARNLLEGHGLEWARQGAPVEGFTHPLWLAAMIPANLPSIPLRLRSLPVQLLSLALLAALVVAVKGLIQDQLPRRAQAGPEDRSEGSERAEPAEPGAGLRAWLPAAALTAFYYPLAYWSLVGMETAAQALLTVLAVRLALAITERQEERHLALWGVCALAYLLRMDLALLALVTQAWVVACGGLREPGGRRRWWQGLALFAGAALGYETFRVLYFHDLLPNTYYLKLTGIPLVVRLLRGEASFQTFEQGLWPLLLAALAGALLLARRERRWLLPASLVALSCAYDVWIGGDAWELSDQAIPIAANRFLAPLMPLLFVLCGVLLERALEAWAVRSSARVPALRSGLAAGVLTLAAFALANGLVFSPDAAEHRRQLALTRPLPNQERQIEVAHTLMRFTRVVSPNALVATAWAGIPAFFSGYRMIDILGYNNRWVARLPSAVPLDRNDWQRYVPGHVKWDERRLLTEQRPDAFFQIWGTRQIGKPHEVLPREGYRFLRRFWVRTDSPFVLRPEQLQSATLRPPHHPKSERHPAHHSGTAPA